MASMSDHSFAPGSTTAAISHTTGSPGSYSTPPLRLVAHPGEIGQLETVIPQAQLQPSGDTTETTTHRPHAQSPIVAPYVPPPRRQSTTRGRPNVLGRVLLFFGFGRNNKERKQLVHFISSWVIDSAQIVSIIALLVYAGRHPSSTNPRMSEWAACDKPLGVWNAVWVPRLLLDLGLVTYNWKKQRAKRLALTGEVSDPEQARRTRSPNFDPYTRTQHRIHGPVQESGNRRISIDAEDASDRPETYSRTYGRLSAMGSLFTLAWFLLAHVFEYTSTNTCRLSSPHIWWLTFALLCVMYLVILEIFLIAVIVFILGPIVFLLWSIFLLCLGRHPMQNPGLIKPEVGKLPKSVVDIIPLVFYIPPPPEEPYTKITFPPQTYSYPPKSSQTSSLSQSSPTLPTSSPTPASPIRKFRFGLLKLAKIGKSSRGKGGGKGVGPNGDGAGDSEKGGFIEKMYRKVEGTEKAKAWEDNWERGEYPFVRLEGNRATCAICLMDFDEPKKVDSGNENNDPEAPADKIAGERYVHEVATPGNTRMPGGLDDDAATIEVELRSDANQEEVQDEDDAELKLEDAGEGAQPLRLLVCGHVFHQTCLDPWLIDVSGRCPTCQRPVDREELEAAIGAVTKKGKKGGKRNRNTSRP